MSLVDWSAATSAHLAAIRAGGRRRINRERQDQARIRDREIERLAVDLGMKRGTRRAIADILGISQASVSRSLKRIKQAWACVCPGCHFYRAQEKPRITNQPKQPTD